MVIHDVRTILIVGAGFSAHAGLPLTSRFTEAMLEAKGFDPGPSRTMIDFLGCFIDDVFGHTLKEKPDSWPELEDVFTCVDLSANTGHHLSSAFSPADLRTVRRAMLCRIIRMLEQKYQRSRKQKDSNWRRLDEFFSAVDSQSVGFISINWDTVVERKLALNHPNRQLDYCCDALAATIEEGEELEYLSGKHLAKALAKALAKGHSIKVMSLPPDRKLMETATPIVKIHGSTNWLYCDNCRQVYWFQPDESNRIADQIITRDDIERILAHLKRKRRNLADSVVEHLLAKPQVRCLCSAKVPLGTRIATFSYRKALDFPMFQKSWLAAEELLRLANKWVFIGYSLPAADYEFKYLLKQSQLSRQNEPNLVVVSGGTREDAQRTFSNYRKFFGGTLKKSNFFTDGLSPDAVAAICG